MSTRELLIVLGGLGVLILLSYLFGIQPKTWASFLLVVPIILGMAVLSYFVLREGEE